MGSIPTMRLLILGLTLLLAISLASCHRGRGHHHRHLVCSNGCKPTCTDGAMPLCADGTTPTEPVRTIRDRTPARMGQLLPGLWLAQLEDGRGAPTTKDLSALM